MRVEVFIENEAGSDQKDLYNEKTLEYRKTVTVSRRYPFAYGFILNTTSGDGDNLDCFVLTDRKLKTGKIVTVEPVGLMEQLEDGGVDHNVLAVPIGKTFNVDEQAENQLREFVSHVFDHLPDKRVSVGRFLSADHAIKLIKKFKDLNL